MDRGLGLNLSEEPRNNEAATSDDLDRIRSVARAAGSRGLQVVETKSAAQKEWEWARRREVISTAVIVLLAITVWGLTIGVMRYKGWALADVFGEIKKLALTEDIAPRRVYGPRVDPTMRPKGNAAAVSPAVLTQDSVGGARRPLPKDAVHMEQPTPIGPTGNFLAQVVDSRQHKLLTGDNVHASVNVALGEVVPLWSGTEHPSSTGGLTTSPLRLTHREVRVRHDEGGDVTRQVVPSYPKEALNNFIEGSVVLHATVDENGAVAVLEPVSGPSALMNAAVDAVRQWQYAPYMRDGKAQPFTTQITVEFSLSK